MVTFFPQKVHSMITTITATFNCPTTIQGVVGGSCDGYIVCFLSFCFVHSLYVGGYGKNFKDVPWDVICRRQLLLDKLPIRRQEIVSPPRDCTNMREDH